MSGNQGQQNSFASGHGGGNKGLMTQEDASRIQSAQVTFLSFFSFSLMLAKGVLLIDSEPGSRRWRYGFGRLCGSRSGRW
jgi:hypothetical protein